MSAAPFFFYELFPELRGVVLDERHSSPLSRALLAMTCKRANIERPRPYKNYVSDAAIVRYLTQMFIEANTNLLRWMLNEQLPKKMHVTRVRAEDVSIPAGCGLAFYLPTRVPESQYNLIAAARENAIPWTISKLAQVSVPQVYQMVVDWFVGLGIPITGHIINPTDGGHIQAIDLEPVAQAVLGDNIPLLDWMLGEDDVNERLSTRTLEILAEKGAPRTRRFIVERWLQFRQARYGRRVGMFFVHAKYRRMLSLAASLADLELVDKVAAVASWSSTESTRILRVERAGVMGFASADTEVEDALAIPGFPVIAVLLNAIEAGRGGLVRTIYEYDGRGRASSIPIPALIVAIERGGLEALKIARSSYSGSPLLPDEMLKRWAYDLYSSALRQGMTGLLDYLYDVEKLPLSNDFLVLTPCIPTNVEHLKWLKARLPLVEPNVWFLCSYFLRVGEPHVAAWFETNYESDGGPDAPVVDKAVKRAHAMILKQTQPADMRFLPIQAGYFLRPCDSAIGHTDGK